MDILEIIGKKRDKKVLTRDEIHYFIKNYVSGEIKDYQGCTLGKGQAQKNGTAT